MNKIKFNVFEDGALLLYYVSIQEIENYFHNEADFKDDIYSAESIIEQANNEADYEQFIVELVEE